MKRYILRLALTAVGLFVFHPVLAIEDAEHSDSVRAEVSLLTCSPGNEVYEIYGHTAIRIVFENGSDWTFNFGLFDFQDPDFTRHFILGETDYRLGVMPTQLFLSSYSKQGRSVDQQVLQLRPDEVTRIVNTLDSLIRIPEWTYRYNFLTDNCTTRAIDVLRRSIDGQWTWPSQAAPTTYRRMIHQYTDKGHPWAAFGQDLVIGASADTLIDRERQMFLPEYAARFVDSVTVVRRDGTREALVTHHVIAAKAEHIDRESSALDIATPTVIAMLLLITTILVSLREYRTGRVTRLLDALLLLIGGLAGCIIALLFFASVHPTVGDNYLILLLNPLLLIGFIMMWRRGNSTDGMPHRGHRIVLDIWAVLAVLTAIAGMTGCQSFPPAVWILALILLIRRGSLAIIRRKATKARTNRK